MNRKSPILQVLACFLLLAPLSVTTAETLQTEDSTPFALLQEQSPYGTQRSLVFHAEESIAFVQTLSDSGTVDGTEGGTEDGSGDGTGDGTEDGSTEATETCTVSFDIGLGTASTKPEDQVLAQDATITKPTDPEYQTFLFDGWYTDQNRTQPWDFDTTITEEMVTAETFTLYAKWLVDPSVTTHTVNFTSNGGSAVASQSIENLGTVTEPEDPTRESYAFLGWYSDSALTTLFDFTTKVEGTLTLFAKWEMNSYTVTFNSGGGTAVESQTILEGGKVTQPETPTRSGYDFQGWYLGSSTEESFDFSTETVTGDFSLTARWSATVYTTSGKVTDYTSVGVEGVSISLYRNGTNVKNTSSDSDGNFSFQDLSSGVYNMTASFGSKTVTTAIEVVSGTNNSLDTIKLPEGIVSSSVSISKETSVQVVNDMEWLTEWLTADENILATVKVTFSAKVCEDENEKSRIDNVISSNYEIIEYLDLEIYKSVTENGSTDYSIIDELPNVMQLVLEVPSGYRNMDGYVIYRVHNDKLDMLTTTPNSAGEYIEMSSNNQYVSLYAKDFSTYALAVVDNDTSSDSDEDEDDEGGTGNTGAETQIFDVLCRTLIHGVETISEHMGTVEFSTSSPVFGTIVVVTPTPVYGYEVDYVHGVTNSGHPVPITIHDSGDYSYEQGNSGVTITVAFVYAAGESATSPFFDVPDNAIYSEAVRKVTDAGLMCGMGNGIFAPQTSITRGMIVSILYTMSSEEYVGRSSFPDVSYSAYYSTAVAWAEARGVVLGYEDGTFRPEESITREELAVIFYSYGQKYVDSQSAVWVFPNTFEDSGDISYWAKEAVDWCVHQDIFNARYQNIFLPQAVGSRSEVAMALVAFL